MLSGLKQLASSSLRYSLDLLLPPLCVSCSALITNHNSVCAKCWRDLKLITPPICDRLGIPLPGSIGQGPHLSATALVEPPLFERARAAAHYTGIIRKLIVGFKFEDKHEPLPLFLKLIRDAGRDLLADADILVPVPLHRLRLLQRRYNQAALLAKGLSQATGLPLSVLDLKRMKRTAPQVSLAQADRRRNVMDAFEVSDRGQSLFLGKRILLIDDVITTGATANACASALLKTGAQKVDVLAIAIVPPTEWHHKISDDADG